MLRDRINISNLNIFKSEYILEAGIDTISYNANAGSYYKTNIEDELLDKYYLYEMADNWIKLESIDTVTGIIKGSFQARYDLF